MVSAFFFSQFFQLAGEIQVFVYHFASFYFHSGPLEE